MRVIFSTSAFADYKDWEKKDPKTFKRINRLIEEIKESPFKGIGNPEPLRHNWSGYWSRRITKEHRLVYKVKDNVLYIAQCKFHY